MSQGATALRTEIFKEHGPFLDIGFGFAVNTYRVTSILPYIGKMTHELYLKKRDAGQYYDCTRGRGKRSLLVMDTGEIYGSAFKPTTIINRQL